MVSIFNTADSHFSAIIFGNLSVQMRTTSTPSAFISCKMLANSAPLVRALRISQRPRYVPVLKLCSSNYQKASFNCNGLMKPASLAAAGQADGLGPREEEHGALEAVLKLYEAIKNRDVNQLSDVIAAECRCVSNFVSASQPFLGKKQVLDFFSCLMRNLGNNLEFVVQQTTDDGLVVSVTWKLEWNKVRWTLGKGFSVYICNVYQGKMMIKNVEIFLEPILHIEPLRLRVISLVMTAMEILNPQAMLKNNRWVIILFFVILFLVAIVLLVKLKHGVPT